MTIGCLVGAGMYLLLTGENSKDIMKKLEYHPEEKAENVICPETVMKADSIWNAMTPVEKEKTIRLYNEFVKE